MTTLTPLSALLTRASDSLRALTGSTCDTGSLWDVISRWSYSTPGAHAAAAADKIDGVIRPAVQSLRDLSRRLADVEAENAALRLDIESARNNNAALRAANSALSTRVDALMREPVAGLQEQLRSMTHQRDVARNALTNTAMLSEQRSTRIVELTRELNAEKARNAALDEALGASNRLAIRLSERDAELSRELDAKDRHIAKLVECNDNQFSTITRYQSKDRKQAREVDTKDATIRDLTCRLGNQGRTIRSYQRENADINERLRDALPLPQAGELPALRKRIAELTAALAASNDRVARLGAALKLIDSHPVFEKGTGIIDWRLTAIERRQTARTALGTHD